MSNTSTDIEELLEMAVDGTLPEDFKEWGIRDEDGWSIGDEAAAYGHLPKDFKEWDLCDENGWTIAHIAAATNHLPEGFNRWNLASNTGWTVAHSAAAYGYLPKDFHMTHPDLWKLTDQDNVSVEDLAIKFGYPTS